MSVPEDAAEPADESLERALRRMDAAYHEALDDLLQRYEAVDHAIMEWIARGTVTPRQEVDALLREMRIRVVAAPGSSQNERG
ncbi:MAG: hypothetical protein ABR599_04910 [Gemmatimonadota bacterium]